MKRFFLSLVLLLTGVGVGLNLPGSNLYAQLEQRTDSPLAIDEDTVIPQVVQKSLPAVVTVAVKKLELQNEPTSQNIGSGFVALQDGLIVTNKHVVNGGEGTYEIITSDNRRYPVEKIYRDPLNDLALLKIERDDLPALPLGDSSKLVLGQLVIAIGTPLGEFRNTVTHGIISGLGRGVTTGSPILGSVERLNNVIQTDAPINLGNSGGPLLDARGEVIGINTAVAISGQNIAFAIPINAAKDLLGLYQVNGFNFERPYLGIRYQLVNKAQSDLNDLRQGAYVLEVAPGSPADKAGLRPQDILTSIDGQEITGADEELLSRTILHKKVGDRVPITFIRDGQAINKEITLEKAS